MSSSNSIRRTFPRFWRLMRHFWPELSRQRGLVAGSFVALIVGIFMQLLEPWPLEVGDRPRHSIIPIRRASAHGLIIFRQKD